MLIALDVPNNVIPRYTTTDINTNYLPGYSSLAAWAFTMFFIDLGYFKSDNWWERSINAGFCFRLKQKWRFGKLE